MKNGDYGFFRWEEEIGKINISWEELQGKLFKNDKVIAKLEPEKIILDKKVKKLKIKKDNLEEAMQDMTNELCQMHAAVINHSRGGKYVVVAVVMSWLIFVIVVMVINL